jgi:hypothetical protein
MLDALVDSEDGKVAVAALSDSDTRVDFDTIVRAPRGKNRVVDHGDSLIEINNNCKI